LHPRCKHFSKTVKEWLNHANLHKKVKILCRCGWEVTRREFRRHKREKPNCMDEILPALTLINCYSDVPFADFTRMKGDPTKKWTIGEAAKFAEETKEKAFQ
jgi:hypothetical protein